MATAPSNLNQEIVTNRVQAAVKSLAMIYTTAVFYNKVLATSTVIQEIADKNEGELKTVLPRIFQTILQDILGFDDGNQLGFNVEKLLEAVNYTRANDFSLLTNHYSEMNRLASEARAETDADKRNDLVQQYNDQAGQFNDVVTSVFKNSAVKNLFDAAFPSALISGMSGTVPFFTALNLDATDIDTVQKILDMDEPTILSSIKYLEDNVADIHISAIQNLTEHSTDKTFITNVGLIKAMLEQYFSYLSQNTVSAVTLY